MSIDDEKKPIQESHIILIPARCCAAISASTVALEKESFNMSQEFETYMSD